MAVLLEMIADIFMYWPSFSSGKERKWAKNKNLSSLKHRPLFNIDAAGGYSGKNRNKDKPPF